MINFIRNMHWLNKIALFIIILISLIVIGTWAGIKFTNFNKHKPQLEQLFLDKTGYILTINGEINVTAIPLKVTITTAEITSTENAKAEVLGQIDEISFNLSLWQLFANQIIMIEAIELKQAKLHWQDAQQNWTLSNINLLASNMLPNAPFDINSQFNFTTYNSLINYHADINSQLKVDSLLQNWQFSDWDGNIVVLIKDQDKQQTLDLTTTGSAFNINMQQANIELNIEAVNAQLKSTTGTISTNFTKQFARNKIVTSKGDIASNEINLKKYLTTLQLNIPNFVEADVLSSTSLNLDWVYENNNLNLQNINLQVDASNLQGKVFVANLTNNQKSHISFNLDVDTLNLDKYRVLVESAKQVNLIATQQPLPSYLPLAIPVNTLRTTEIAGDLNISSLTASGILFKDFTTTLFNYKGSLDLAPLDARLYSGNIKSRLRLDVTGTTPSYSWSGKATNIALKPFLSDSFNYKNIAGKFNSTFALNSKGVNKRLLIQNLNGSFTGSIEEGSYIGIDLLKIMSLAKPKSTDQTNFSSLRLTGRINNGVFNARRLNLNSELFNAIGLLEYDLNKNYINAQLFTTFNKLPWPLSSFENTEIPFKIQGPLNNLTWQLGL